MLILIEKDSATRIPKEVNTVEEAQAYASEFQVFVVDDEAGTVPLADWIAVQEPQVGEQVQELTTDDLSALSTSQLEALTTSEVRALTTEQAQALTTSDISAL